MTHKNKRTQFNSRARAKHIKCVRVRCLVTRSTNVPNASDSEIVYGCRFTSDHAPLTSVPLKAAKASTKSECSQKASRRSQSPEVLQNAPIIERAFCRSSSEKTARSCCHFPDDVTEEQKAYPSVKEDCKKSAKNNDIFEGFTDFERTLIDICIGWIGFDICWKNYIKDNADLLLKIASKNLTH